MRPESGPPAVTQLCETFCTSSVEPGRGMTGDASEDIGKPSLRINAVHFGGNDQTVHGCGLLAATVGAGEEPRLAPERNAAQGAFCSVVRQADAPVWKRVKAGPRFSM